MWRRDGDLPYSFLVLAVVTAEAIALGALTLVFSLRLVNLVPGGLTVGLTLFAVVAVTATGLVVLTGYILVYHLLSIPRERRRSERVRRWTGVWTAALYAGEPIPATPRRDVVEAGLELRELLRGEDGWRLSELLEQAGVGAFLVPRLSSRRLPARLEALDGLARSKLPSALGAVMEGMGDPNELVRLVSARAAARILAGTRPGPVRSEGARSVGVALVVAGLPRGAVVEVLLLLDDAAAEVLRTLFSNRDLPAALTRACLDAVGRLELAEFARDVAARLADGDDETRAAALRALGRMGTLPRGTRGMVVAAMDDPVEFVRVQATRPVAFLRPDLAARLLWKAMGDPSWWVRRGSAESLLALGPRGVEALTRATADHPDRYARDMAAHVLLDADPAGSEDARGMRVSS